MCWYSNILIPIRLKKSIRVYKVGIRATPELFFCKYTKYGYVSQVLHKIETLEPEDCLKRKNYSIYCIHKGFHSYASLSSPALKQDLNHLGYKIGVFEIPKGAEIYVNSFGEIVSSDIIYLGNLTLFMNTWLFDLKELHNKLQNNPIKNGVAIYWLNKQIEKLEYKLLLKSILN